MSTNSSLLPSSNMVPHKIGDIRAEFRLLSPDILSSASYGYLISSSLYHLATQFPSLTTDLPSRLALRPLDVRLGMEFETIHWGLKMEVWQLMKILDEMNHWIFLTEKYHAMDVYVKRWDGRKWEQLARGEVRER